MVYGAAREFTGREFGLLGLGFWVLGLGFGVYGV